MDADLVIMIENIGGDKAVNITLMNGFWAGCADITATSGAITIASFGVAGAMFKFATGPSANPASAQLTMSLEQIRGSTLSGTTECADPGCNITASLPNCPPTSIMGNWTISLAP